MWYELDGSEETPFGNGYSDALVEIAPPFFLGPSDETNLICPKQPCPG